MTSEQSCHGNHSMMTGTLPFLYVKTRHSLFLTVGFYVTLLWALRPDVGGWVTLSPRYWTGVPSYADGGRAPYSAVLDCDL